MAWILIIVGASLVGFALYVWIFVYEKDSGSVQDRADLVSRKYTPEMNRFQARKETKAAEARTELGDQLSKEAAAVIEVNNRQTQAETCEFIRQENWSRLRRMLELETAEHRTALLQNALTNTLIGEAAQRNLDVATYLELQKKTEMNRLDLDQQWAEAEQQLKAGFIFQLQGHQHLALMTEYIGKLYDRAEVLRVKGKDREYRLIEEHIEFMEGDFRDRQKRLLQTNYEEDVSGSNEDSDARRDSQETVQAADE